MWVSLHCRPQYSIDNLKTTEHLRAAPHTIFYSFYSQSFPSAALYLCFFAVAVRSPSVIWMQRSGKVGRVSGARKRATQWPSRDVMSARRCSVGRAWAPRCRCGASPRPAGPKKATSTHQVVVDGLFAGLVVRLLDFGGPEGVRDVQRAGVEAAVLVALRGGHRGRGRRLDGRLLMVRSRRVAVQVRPDVERLGVEGAGAARATNLLVDHRRGARHVERRADADRLAVQVSRTALRDVTAAVDFLVILAVLVVQVGFQRQFGAARRTLEATAVEEAEVLQRPDSVHLVDGLLASQTRRFVKVHAIHFTWRPCSLLDQD